HRLGSIDIAYATDLGLIKKKLFDVSLRDLEDACQIFDTELVRKRFGCQLREIPRLEKLSGIDDLHQTEMPLIAEYESFFAVEMKDGMGILRIVLLVMKQH